MAISDTQKADILKVVAGLFNAAPGGVYLTELANFVSSGGTIQQLSNGLATNPIFTTNILAGKVTIEDQVDVLMNHFGVTADSVAGSAGSQAHDYFHARLEAGDGFGDIVYDAITFLSTTTDAAFAEAKTLLENKVKVADAFSKVSTSTDFSTLQQTLSKVTGTAPYTAEDVQAILDGSGGIGKSFSLTVNQDSGAAFVGTAGVDIFEAAAQNVSGTLTNTLQSVDSIDGGAGIDSLNATLAQAGAVAATIKNIEKINVRFADGGAKLDLANTTGATTVTVADSTTAGAVNNIGDIASLAIKNQKQNVNIGGTAGTATTVALDLNTVGTDAAAITLDLGVDNASKATTANITANNAYVDINSTNADVFKTASIAATGTNVLTFADSAATLTGVTITGSGAVDLTGAALAAVTTFDASGSTGAVSAELTQAAKAVTITTGGGDDVIDGDAIATAGSSANLGGGNDTLFVGANLAAFDKGANGGDGTDIINITDGSTLTSTTAKYITNFETLDVSGGTGDYDVSLNSFATVQIDEAIAGALAGDVNFTNAPDTFVLNIASEAATDANFDIAKNITVTGKDYAGTTAKGTAESFTLVATINDGNKDNAADGDINAQTVTVAGVENLTIQAKVGTLDGGSDALKASKSTLTAKIVAADAETLTITGDASVDLTSVTTIGAVTKVNASGSTGNVKIDFSTHAKSVAYTGSDGVDTYTAGTKGDIIYTGKGADVVALDAKAGAAGAVRDTFVLKAATDSKITDTSKDAKITLGADTGFDVVTNFDSVGDPTPVANTSDRLDLTNFGFSGTQRAVVDVSGSVDGTTDLTSITDLFDSPAGDRGVAYTSFGGNSYVFVDVNKDGNFTAADDLVVELAGVTSVSETMINF